MAGEAGGACGIVFQHGLMNMNMKYHGYDKARIVRELAEIEIEYLLARRVGEQTVIKSQERNQMHKQTSYRRVLDAAPLYHRHPHIEADRRCGVPSIEERMALISSELETVIRTVRNAVHSISFEALPGSFEAIHALLAATECVHAIVERAGLQRVA